MDVVSQCPLRVAHRVWLAGHGVFALTVVCKATFELAPELSPLAVTQEPVRESDEYAGAQGLLVHASEVVPLKRRPEVLLAGCAHAPEGRPVRSLVARLSVGAIDKAIEVVGDRSFGLDGHLGEPARFTRMELGWERAAGGPDTSNPAGVALGDGARVDVFGRVAAPNLFAAGTSLLSRNDVIAPVGFGPISPRWPARLARLHQHAADWDPERWHERTLPPGLDVGYFNAAPADQQREAPFADDSLYLENLHPRFARLATRLAPLSPVAVADTGTGAPQTLKLRCDTLTIDTERGLATLVWRAHLLISHPEQAGRVLVTEASAAAGAAVLPAWAAVARDPKATLALVDSNPTEGGELPFTSTGSFRAFSAPSGPPVSSVPVPPAPTFGPPPASTSMPVAAAPSFGPPPSSASMPVPPVPTFGTPPASASMPVPPAPTFGPPPAVAAGASQVPASQFGSPGVPSRRGVTLMASETKSVVLPFEARSAAAPAPDSAPAASPPAIETAALSSTGALPFRQIEGARVGGSALGRSMKLGLKVEEPAPPPVVAAPPAALDLDHDTERPPPPPGPSEPLPAMAWAPPPAFVPLPSPAADTFSPAPVAIVGAEPVPAFVPPPSSPEAAAPPPFLGALAPREQASESLEADAPAPAPAAAEASAPEAPAPPFDDYPPARCGAIAARLACDPAAEKDLLEAEQLDARTWPLVHAHWQELLVAAAARRDRKLLAEYDQAYVAALEQKRGAIAMDDYVTIAEAAERGEEAHRLEARGLPASAWPPLQRVWIERMVKDMALAGLVRRALRACRAAAG